MPPSPHRRASDQSFISMIKEKVLPPLIVASIIGGFGGGVAFYKKLDSVDSKLPQIIADIASMRLALEVERNERIRLQSDVAAMRGQMVGWDSMKRMELFITSQLNGRSKPSEVAGAMAGAIRSEIDSRKEKP